MLKPIYKDLYPVDFSAVVAGMRARHCEAVFGPTWAEEFVGPFWTAFSNTWNDMVHNGGMRDILAVINYEMQRISTK